MKAIRARVDSHRRILLPPEAAEELGAQPGDEVELTVAGHVLEEPPSAQVDFQARYEALMRRFAPLKFEGPPASSEELDAEIREAHQRAVDDSWRETVERGG